MISTIIVILFVLSLYLLIVRLNKSFPIIELTVMLYVLQYLVAPLFDYNFNPNHGMAVAEGEYLQFTLLVVLAFSAGLFVVKPALDVSQLSINKNQASLLGRTLLFVGFSSQIAMTLLPESLQSLVNFFILFKTIGVYALIFSDKRLDKALIIFFSIQIALSSILGAMLIDFIIFALFFVMFFSLRYKLTNKFKYSIFIAGFLFLSVYQGIKAEYRDLVWEQELTTEQKVALLGTLINLESFEAAFTKDLKNNESLVQTMHRLNQGWQTSKVYKHVPSVVNFSGGREFLKDVFSSLMPRILWKDKRVVNDQDRFYYYTGYFVNKSTAMTLGVIGDFYLNFGKIGTAVALFLFGYFIAKVKRYFVVNFVYSNPINLIWLPFIFSYLIRPGNEFYMVLNHLLKSAVILIVVFYILYPWLRIENEESFPEELETENEP